MNTNKYQLEVLVNGKTVAQYSHNGNLFIEGRAGTQYTVKVTNKTNKRVLAIVSVDQLCVIDGKPATQESPGFIINPWASVDVKGFSKDMNEAGTFMFTEKDKSYTQEMNGSTEHCGVIGCMIIDEKVDPNEERLKELQRTIDRLKDEVDKKEDKHNHWWPWTIEPYKPIWVYSDFYRSCDNGSSVNQYIYSTQRSDGISSGLGDAVRCCNMSNVSSNCTQDVESIPNFDLGTTWGEKVKFNLQEGVFERGVIVETSAIYYASKDSLIKMGVPLTKEVKVAFPQAFATFAKPPAHFK